MGKDTEIAEPIVRFAAGHLNAPADTLDIALRPLPGGLVSRSVQWVVAQGPGSSRRAFVAKQVDAADWREAHIHSALFTTPARSLAPALLGVHDGGRSPGWLFLEAITRAQPWPWRDVERAGDVLRALARLHALGRSSSLSGWVSWDYERELRERGERLVALLASHRLELCPHGLSNSAWFVRRFVERLGPARRRMLALPAMPPSIIHGDVHSGNVLLGARADRVAPVFLDWGRARIGSPLEDVSSWLQSLGFWEPCARQRHDTLLRAYLSARGHVWPPSADLRGAYWVAAACNGIAGAAEWHLRQAIDSTLGSVERSHAAAALRAQLRMLRRAYEYECVTRRSTHPPRSPGQVPHRSAVSFPARHARAGESRSRCEGDTAPSTRGSPSGKTRPAG